MGDKFEKLRAFLESEEGKKSMDDWFNKLEVKDKILEGRLVKVHDYLKNNSLDVLMERLKEENGDEWCNRCYGKGFEPYPTNLLYLLIDYVNEYGDEPTGDDVEEDEYGFLSREMILGDYKFQLFCGQGCFNRILKKINGEWELFFQN